MATTAASLLTVELYGRLADPLGREVALAIPPDGLTAATLIAALATAHPALAPDLTSRRIRAGVNDVLVAPDTRIRPGDRVALFPPVSGG